MTVDSWAWVFFSGFILIGSFMVLNPFVGVVVSAIQSRIATEAAADASRDEALGVGAGRRDGLWDCRPRCLTGGCHEVKQSSRSIICVRRIV